MLKKVFFLVIIILVTAGGWFANQVKAGNLQAKVEYSVCDTPIYYKIGEIDEKFGTKKEKLVSAANRAAQIWNKEASRDLFLYKMEDPDNRAITINFKYDRRQALTSEINQLEGKVYKDEASLKRAIRDYESKVDSFNARMEEFNREAEEWNEKGGAPADVYERLKDQQRSLQEEALSLSVLAKELNASVERYNSQVGKLNITIESFNTEISRRPEEGLFNANENKIEIFFFANDTELIHTLAHEFGHARGLDHVEDEEAIMFPYTTNVLGLSEKDIEQLNLVCARRNIFNETIRLGKTMGERYKLIFERISQRESF